jgi:hypothetical protein
MTRRKRQTQDQRHWLVILQRAVCVCTLISEFGTGLVQDSRTGLRTSQTENGHVCSFQLVLMNSKH